ncbi:hypothetical protein O988_08948 [Pseudogymnoascus sp. VKM F-3808]|nr:hypothetical protein O988_08948 [Pseudogymnoascus sp. VKM F-3808]
MSDLPPASLQPTPATTIVDVLNPAKEQRDSAYYSGASTNGDASKHNSIAAPQNTGSITPSPSTGYQSSTADMTPSPIATGHAHAPQPLASPVSGGMSITSMVTSPTTPSSMDESMLAKLNPAYNAPGQRISTASIADSRRESVDGRINSGFEGMRLQGNSPYASNNQSTTSIQSSLQQQRNPGAVNAHLSVSSADRLSARFPNTYQPNSQRYVRTAPTITGPAASAVANAAEPTKGQPWAFPDDTDRRASMNPSEIDSHATSYLESRRSSIADSMASSQYTTESRLPHGQRRLEDGYQQTEFQPLPPRGSSEFHGVAHHHHSLQHRQVGDIRDEEGGSPGSTQPYSRTPELRKSHKMAERKRRNEMKELYDELREMLPSERGNKTSKWEILSKSIAQHKAQDDRYHNLEQHYRQMQSDNARKDAELQRTRDETAELRTELRALRHEFSLIRGDMQPHAVPVSQAPPPVDAYANDPYRARQEARPEVGLPPLRSLNTPIPAPFPQQQQQQPPADSMTGVQYHQERPATNGYAPAYQPRV